MESRIASRLPAELCLPAGGQGAVGIECRTEDRATLELLACLNHPQTHTRITAERALNRHLQGGCQVPIACFSELQEDYSLWVRALVGSVDGSVILENEIRGPAESAEQLGIELAEKLLAAGAGDILAEVYGSDQ